MKETFEWIIGGDFHFLAPSAILIGGFLLFVLSIHLYKGARNFYWFCANQNERRLMRRIVVLLQQDMPQWSKGDCTFGGHIYTHNSGISLFVSRKVSLLGKGYSFGLIASALININIRRLDKFLKEQQEQKIIQDTDMSIYNNIRTR